VRDAHEPDDATLAVRTAHAMESGCTAPREVRFRPEADVDLPEGYSHGKTLRTFPMRCIEIVTSDNRMDCRDLFRDPINRPPTRCRKCGFPELDLVPQPYLLVKAKSITSNELAGAENGNFLVRERVRRVLELVAPGQCAFFPTSYEGSGSTTPWSLAVPSRQVVTATVDPAIARCEACGEPRSAHPGSQWKERLFGVPYQERPPGVGWTAETDVHVLKSSTWGSSENGWDEWISRSLFLSIRLVHLLRRIEAKGFHESTCQKPLAPNAEESAWIAATLAELAAAGIPLRAQGTVSKADRQWLRGFVRRHAGAGDWSAAMREAERRLRMRLPKSYRGFIGAVGPVRFDEVDGEAGLDVSILTPDRVEHESGYAEFEDEESKAINALTFARSNQGDRFCFDVQEGRTEFAVVVYNHEGNFFEPYADNFAACIRRFAGDREA
jgi:hypothetical protein